MKKPRLGDSSLKFDYVEECWESSLTLFPHNTHCDYTHYPGAANFILLTFQCLDPFLHRDFRVLWSN